MKVPFVESSTREKMEIITIKISMDQNYLAVLGGKILIKQVEELWHLHVFRIEYTGGEITFESVSKYDPDNILPKQFRSYSKSIEFCCE